MHPSNTFAIAAVLTLAAVASPVSAAAPRTEPIVLEAVVVTPTARYTAAEWQARVAARQTLAAVTLERVIVTPAGHYTVAQWQQRQTGLLQAKQTPRHGGVKAWLKTVWKHFAFRRTPVEA